MTVDPGDAGWEDRIGAMTLMSTLMFLVFLYLKYFVIVLALGVVVAAGLWCWLGLASFARSEREDR